MVPSIWSMMLCVAAHQEQVHGDTVGQHQISNVSSQENVIRTSADTLLWVVELVYDGRVSKFELFMRDLDAPANAVAVFCRHTRVDAHACSRVDARATPRRATPRRATPRHAAPRLVA